MKERQARKIFKFLNKANNIWYNHGQQRYHSEWKKHTNALLSIINNIKKEE